MARPRTPSSSGTRCGVEVPESDNVWSRCLGLLPGWNVQIGWCGAARRPRDERPGQPQPSIAPKLHRASRLGCVELLGGATSIAVPSLEEWACEQRHENAEVEEKQESRPRQAARCGVYGLPEEVFQRSQDERLRVEGWAASNRSISPIAKAQSVKGCGEPNR